MAKWWRKILLVIVAGGLFCLLAACDRNLGDQLLELGEKPATQLTTPSDLQAELAVEAAEAYDHQLAAEFNDDWRDQWEQASSVNALDSMGDAIEIAVTGSGFEEADYQHMVADYLQRLGDAWLAESAAEPDSRYAIDAFQVVGDSPISYMTATGEIPAFFVCTLNYAIIAKNDASSLYAGGGRSDYPQAGWHQPFREVVFRIDSNNIFSCIAHLGQPSFEYGKVGLIPIGHINDARRLYGWYTDNAPQLDTETVTVAGSTYYRVAEDYFIEPNDTLTSYDALCQAIEYYLPEDIAAELLATDTFIDVEGDIYMKERADAARPQIISEKWSIVEEAWERCVYRAEVVRLEDGVPVTINCDYVFEEGKLVDFDYF